MSSRKERRSHHQRFLNFFLNCYKCQSGAIFLIQKLAFSFILTCFEFSHPYIWKKGYPNKVIAIRSKKKLLTSIFEEITCYTQGRKIPFFFPERCLEPHSAGTKFTYSITWLLKEYLHNCAKGSSSKIF